MTENGDVCKCIIVCHVFKRLVLCPVPCWYRCVFMYQMFGQVRVRVNAQLHLRTVWTMTMINAHKHITRVNISNVRIVTIHLIGLKHCLNTHDFHSIPPLPDSSTILYNYLVERRHCWCQCANIIC